MKIKKANAILGLLTIPLMLAHIGYLSYCYLTMSLPAAKNPLSYPLMAVCGLHAMFGMSALFFRADGTQTKQYARLNRKTILQRLTAILTIPLLVLHINTWRLLESASGNGQWFLFGLLLFAEALFFAVVLTHVAVSWTNALVTMGWLTSMDKKKKMDIAGYIVLALVFAAAVYAVLPAQIAMFAS